MTPDTVVDIMHRMLLLALMLSAPLLLAGLVVGLAVAVFQAATSIQESSLSFVPKIIAIGLALAIAGPWTLEVLTDFTVELIEGISTMAPGAM